MKRGDKVWGFDYKKDELICDRVVAQKSESFELAHFFTFETDDFGPRIKLTNDHYVYVKKKDVWVMKTANKVKEGDILRTKYGDGKISKISSSLEYPVRYYQIIIFVITFSLKNM